MKHHSRLIILMSLLAASGMPGCDNDRDPGNSETPPNCQLTQADCNSQGKTLDAANCLCVDSGLSQENCALTEAMCASANKTLDIQNCICVDSEIPQSCPFEDMTLSIGQKICGHNNDIITCLTDGKLQTEECERGICTNGDCIAQNCGDIQDGQYTCRESILST